MTEEDTFQILKRQPYTVVYDFYMDSPLNTDYPNHSYFTDNGWTWNEFCAEYTRRFELDIINAQ